MNRQRIGPVTGGDTIKALDDGVEIAIDQHTGTTWDFYGIVYLARFWIGQATYRKRRSRLRMENALQGRKLHRLRAREETSIGIAADDLQGNSHGAHCHSQYESFTVIAIALAAQYGS